MGSRIIYFCICICFLLETGCHIDHDFHSRPLPLACTDVDSKVMQALDTPSVTFVEKVPLNWWTFFADPQLNRMIDAALECHPDIALASARLRRAAEEALHARSILYPHLNFDAEIFRQKISDNAAIPYEKLLFTEAGLDFIGKWDLDIWNRNRSLFYSNLDEVQAAFADREAAKLLLSSAIAEVYFDLQGFLERINIANGRLQEKKNLYALLKQRFEKGIIDQFRLYETDQDIALLEDQIYQFQLQIEIDKNALAALVGNATRCCLPGAELSVNPSGHFSDPFPLPRSLPLDLIARRPEIVAKKWQIEAACYNIKADQAAFYPNVNLVGFLGLRSLELSKLLRGPSIEYLVDAALDLPIYNAGELQSNLGIAREDYEIAVDEYNRLILDAVREVSDALSSLVTADERDQNIKKALEDAQNLYSLTLQRFESGINNYISVLNALDNIYVQQDLAAVIQMIRLKAAVDLFHSIGGGYHE